MWSDTEIEFLVAAYKQTDKPRHEDILKIIPFLEDGRTIKQIKNWFMNQRQKAKKAKKNLEEFRAQVSARTPLKSYSKPPKIEASFTPNTSYGSLSPTINFSPGGPAQSSPSMPLLNPIMNPFMNRHQLFNPFQPFYWPYGLFPPLYNPPVPMFSPMRVDLDQTLDFSNEEDPDFEIFVPDPCITVE